MSGQSKKIYKVRLTLLNAVIVFLTFAGIFSSCGSKKKLHHHVLHVNDLYMDKDSLKSGDAPKPDYDNPSQGATRYGVRPTN